MLIAMVPQIILKGEYTDRWGEGFESQSMEKETLQVLQKIQALGNSNPAHELFKLHLNSIYQTPINSSAQHMGEGKG